MFITFEGPEGSGKTSVLKRVFETLIAKGYPVILTREPGGTPIAEQIRDVILDKANTALDARAEALLYAASRRQHLVEKVWPALRDGKVVLCDRFLDSSLAYQGGARGLGIDEVLNINQFAIEGKFPDLTLLFDLDPEIGFARIEANPNREVNRLDLEERAFHIKVRELFLELSRRFKERYLIIDASEPFDTVYEKTLKIVEEHIKK